MISLLLAPQEISSALALIERRRPISKLLRSYIEGAKRHIMCRKAHIVEKLQADGLEFFLVTRRGPFAFFALWAKNICVAAVQPAASDSPPDCRI